MCEQDFVLLWTLLTLSGAWSVHFMTSMVLGILGAKHAVVEEFSFWFCFAFA